MRVPIVRECALSPTGEEAFGSLRPMAWWGSLSAWIGRIAGSRRAPVAPAAMLPEAGDGARHDLVTAIVAGELRLVYQPKLHLRSRKIVSLEALVRWQHPQSGLILPNDFVPAAEQSGDILALSLWVLERAMLDQQWLGSRGHDLPLFVNIAGVLLADGDFIDRACAMVLQGGSRIGFEITETSVIRDPEAAIANLKKVADLGIAIAIDDYGAGLSSLAYLKQLPARELKIDRMFITQLTSSHRDPLIVRSTIDLAHAMEMEVVGEGVETATALALLSVMGCDMAQGFHIGRPVDVAAIDGFLERHRDGWSAAGDCGSLTQFTSVLKRA